MYQPDEMLLKLKSNYAKWFLTCLVTIFIVMFIAVNIGKDIVTVINTFEPEKQAEVGRMNMGVESQCEKTKKIVFLKTHKVTNALLYSQRSVL